MWAIHLCIIRVLPSLIGCMWSNSSLQTRQWGLWKSPSLWREPRWWPGRRLTCDIYIVGHLKISTCYKMSYERKHLKNGLMVAVCLSARQLGIGATLQCHPFSGLVEQSCYTLLSGFGLPGPLSRLQSVLTNPWSNHILVYSGTRLRYLVNHNMFS